MNCLLYQKDETAAYPIPSQMKGLGMVKTKLLMPVIVCALILTACGKEPMPEVNDVNCAPEKRKQIKDRETRQEFTELCWQVEHERAVKGEYKPLENPKKTWDELFAPADQGK